MDNDKTTGISGWRRDVLPLVLVGVLPIGASCDDEGQGEDQGPCEELEACQGVRGHCFLLGGDEAQALEVGGTEFRADASGELEGSLLISSTGSNPFPYFSPTNGTDSGGFSVNSSNSTGVFESGGGSLKITSCSSDGSSVLGSGTSWGWCAVDNNGTWQDEIHQDSDCKSTLMFSAVDGNETKYRLRIWGVESGNMAIAGDPKIKVKGSSTDPPPVPAFPPQIPVCPSEYSYYKDCLPGQYNNNCVISESPKYSYDGESNSGFYGDLPNVTSPFWLYRSSSSGDRIGVAESVRSDINTKLNHYGPASNINPLTLKFVLSEGGDEGAQHAVFYNITSLANYSAAVTKAPALPPVGESDDQIQWKLVSYDNDRDQSNYDGLYASTTAFLNCLSSIQPTMVAYAQIAMTNDTEKPASISIMFPYSNTAEDTDYKNCARGANQGGGDFNVYCDGSDTNCSGS